MNGSIIGRIQVELTSADAPRTLKTINEYQIPVFQLRQINELSADFWIDRGDYPKLRQLCAKRGDSLKILRRAGLYWLARRMLRRPVLVLGLLFFMVLGMYLPGRVLFVRVEGNENIPARQILSAAENCGVGFGASRRYVRSEKVKNALLGAIPELGWAGVNTSGCTAVISVRERTSSREAAAPLIPAAIVADRDGFLLWANVTRGTALFQTGQTVRKGQTLISGFTDCGLCIRATGAEGEVFAQTKRSLQVILPTQYAVRREQSGLFRKYSLRFQKKRINLWKDSGICDTTCGRMYKEYHITLPGGFRLPISLCVEEYTNWSTERKMLEQAEAVLVPFGEAYLKSQMISGEILNRKEILSSKEGLLCLDGTYDCTEMIGRAQKIGEANGKRD